MGNAVIEAKTKKAHRNWPKTLIKKTQGTHGLVDFIIHTGSGQISGQIKGVEFNAAKIVRVIQEGVSVQELSVLQAALDMPMERLAPKLGISRATLNRRMASGRLQPEESDRLVRFARLMGKAVETFESEESARRWLTSAQIGLGGAVPLDYAETEVGAREVEDLLGRIEYGVYS